MHRTISFGVITAALLGGCDARVDDRYRGEPLLKITGSLTIDNPLAAGDLVPALAFMDRSATLHILDVDTQGQFPASFSLSVMSPPPAAGVQAFAGLPGVAIGYLTALPAQHASTLQFPQEVDGMGAFTWCERPGNDSCFRRIEQCTAGTDECYRELARCRGMAVDGVTQLICDEILEQSGDPKIARPWESFAGLSTNHLVLYVAGDAPAGSARAYAKSEELLGFYMASAFGREPIPAGYHVIRTRPRSEAELAALEPCYEAGEADALAHANAQNGTSFTSYDELVKAAQSEAPEESLTHKYHRDYQGKLVDALYDRDCLKDSFEYERIPAHVPVEITIGTKGLRPVW
jgi:hypothetical protein